MRAKLVKSRDIGKREAFGVAKRARVLIGRFPMRADRRGVRARCRSVREHRGPVAGGVSVVRNPCQAVIADGPRDARVARARRCRLNLLAGVTDSSSARRASSCLNATMPFSETSMPERNALVEPDVDLA